MTDAPPDDALVSVREGARLAGMEHEAFKKRLDRGSGRGVAVIWRFGKRLVRRSECLRLAQAEALRGGARGG